MSSKGIYTALSGAIAQADRLDTIANNIANSNTTAFKKDQQTFYEYITANEKEAEFMKVPRVPASIESFYDMQGGDRGYVDSSGTYTDFTQGELKPTGNPYDLSLRGKGFFEVLTTTGVKYTRHGRFKINQNNELVTSLGHPVLSADNTLPNEQRVIKLDGKKTFAVGFDGTISIDGQQLGKLSVVDTNEMDGLKKLGANYYTTKANYNVNFSPASDTQIYQGFTESSNVNIVREMTDMISATRNFESTQKAIKAYDQMNAKLVNDVPKTY